MPTETRATSFSKSGRTNPGKTAQRDLNTSCLGVFLFTRHASPVGDNPNGTAIGSSKRNVAKPIHRLPFIADLLDQPFVLLALLPRRGRGRPPRLILPPALLALALKTENGSSRRDVIDMRYRNRY